MNRILLIVLLAASAQSTGVELPPAVDGSVPAELDTLVPLLMARHRVPGVAFIGIENRRLAWERYFGVREAGKAAPVDEHAIFEAASMTKPLAAYAALKLVVQGKLDLDKPLATYLPEPYLEDEPLHEKITARMVLTHTSGFPNWRPRGKPLKVLHEPGSKFGYSGEGFQFLQRVIVQVSGEEYELFMQRTLLRPIGMTHSSHVWQAAFAVTAAAGHDGEGNVKSDRRLYNKPNAAYSLYCTPRDYAAFVLEMLNPDRGAAHSLGAESLSAMLTATGPPTGRPLHLRSGSKGAGDARFGLGWLIEPTASGDRICHSGSNGTGFRSFVEFDAAKGHGLLIMTNSVGGDDLWRELIAEIAAP